MADLSKEYKKVHEIQFFFVLITWIITMIIDLFLIFTFTEPSYEKKAKKINILFTANLILTILRLLVSIIMFIFLFYEMHRVRQPIYLSFFKIINIIIEFSFLILFAKHKQYSQKKNKGIVIAHMVMMLLVPIVMVPAYMATTPPYLRSNDNI